MHIRTVSKGYVRVACDVYIVSTDRWVPYRYCTKKRGRAMIDKYDDDRRVYTLGQCTRYDTSANVFISTEFTYRNCEVHGCTDVPKS